MAKILILGGGFAAISAAETLAPVIGEGHEIILVSKSSDFTFYPAIVPMVFGSMRPEEIRNDLRPKLAERDIRFIHGEVRGINTQQRTVEVGCDRSVMTFAFDYLIVAIGPRMVSGLVPGLLENAHDLLTIDGAIKFKEAVSKFKSGSIVVGLCPEATLPVPVCESALALSARFSEEIKRGEISVSAIFPSSVEKAFAGSTLFRDVRAEFDRKEIQLVSEFPIARVESNEIVSSAGDSIHHDLLMLIPPLASQLSLYDLGPITDICGFAKVDPLMKVADLDRIYAAGDIVSMPGPKFGYMAIRQGKVAALNILAELHGHEPSTEYAHKIEWAIGERYTDPIFFHYGFWDNTLDDFNENALFGMAKTMRERYGPLDLDQAAARIAPV